MLSREFWALLGFKEVYGMELSFMGSFWAALSALGPHSLKLETSRAGILLNLCCENLRCFLLVLWTIVAVRHFQQYAVYVDFIHPPNFIVTKWIQY
jgi:hypothetical protein